MRGQYVEVQWSVCMVHCHWVPTMTYSGGYRGGGRGDHPPPLVAENFVCSNSNFSPTGAITPDHPPPLVAITPPPLVAITPPPSENPVSAPDVCSLPSLPQR